MDTVYLEKCKIIVWKSSEKETRFIDVVGIGGLGRFEAEERHAGGYNVECEKVQT